MVEDKFTQVFEALKIYKSLIDESLQVPTSYTVPTESKDWPDELLGLRLGALVQGTLIANVMVMCLGASINVVVFVVDGFIVF